VDTETSVTVNFRLVDVGSGKYSVHIDDATTGGAVDVKFRSPPKYPRNEMIKGRSGLAVLDVAYGADGQVTDIRLADGAPAVADDFAKAAISAIRLWKFSPEFVGGHALAGHVVTPMCFTVERRYGTARPPTTLPPSPMCEWRPPGAATPLHDGEVMALAPVARLRDDVTTHAM
jgi:TonB family protein